MKNLKLVAMLLGVAVLVLASAGKLYATQEPDVGAPSQNAGGLGEASPSPQMFEIQPPAYGETGTGFAVAHPRFSRDLRRRIMAQELKFYQDNTSLMDQLETKRAEMQIMMLDSMPSADRLIAKMREINQLELTLREKEINNWFMVYGMIPANERTGIVVGQDFGIRPRPGRARSTRPSYLLDWGE